MLLGLDVKHENTHNVYSPYGNMCTCILLSTRPHSSTDVSAKHLMNEEANKALQIKGSYGESTTTERRAERNDSDREEI